MTESVARLLFPFAVAVAVAIWAKGYSEVGDGFSAGAFAGLGAVLQYAALDHDRAARTVGAKWVRQFVCWGLFLALAVLLGPSLLGILPVTHYPAPGEHVPTLGVIEAHTALLLDLGIALLVYGAFVGTFDRLFLSLRGDEG